METTKLAVEYLIVGILVTLAIFFLAFNLAPREMAGLSRQILEAQSEVSTSLILIFLPVSYGIGLVAEYLGMIIYEGRMRKVKRNRFRPYIEDKENLKWIKHSQLLAPYVHKDKLISDEVAGKAYGEMRFFVLMKNAALYAEIESQINRFRILRVLTVVELIFILGFLTQLVRFRGLTLPGGAGLVMVLALLLLNIGTILKRFERYCQAIERSYKVLMLAQIEEQAKK